jgi:membrane protease YdiL (CAAX protease family)
MMPDMGNLFTALLFNALVPAVAEELFFRGGVQQASTGWLRNGHAAVWFTAIVFSFIHFDMIGFPARVLMGATLGYLFYFTGSLQVSVLAHFCFNAFTIMVSYLEQQNTSGFWASFNVPVAVGFVALGIIVALLYVLFRNSKKVQSL